MRTTVVHAAKFYPPAGGGMETVLRDLCDGTAGEWTVQVVAANMLRGIGDVRIPTVITLIAYWGIALPLGYLVGIRGTLGAPGVWIGIAGGLAFAAVFLSARLARLTRAGV